MDPGFVVYQARESKNSRTAMIVPVGMLFFVLGMVGTGFLFGFLSLDIDLGEASESEEVVVLIHYRHDRETLADKIQEVFDWNEAEREYFQTAFHGMQWDALNQDLVRYLSRELSWGEGEEKAFLTRGSSFVDPETDILSTLYVPGTYRFKNDENPVEVAATLVLEIKARYRENLQVFIKERINPNTIEGVRLVVQEVVELLPDLIPYPPQSIIIQKEAGKTRLSFDTTYYNIGRGDLELIPGEGQAPIEEETGHSKRDISQRIYKTDGSYRDVPAGTFVWHDEHLHYHFADFVEFRLESLEGNDALDNEKTKQKTTFCVRDVTRIGGEYRYGKTSAKYRTCGEEHQGVSVGWGDTYFYTYADQGIDITDVPSGTYRLSFAVNPEERLIESDYTNNTSSVVITIDTATGDVRVQSIMPDDIPGITHIHTDVSK